MRPRRIEMEGFSAFRDRAEIDLADTELFALVGPTGAGKSSVIDAMVFALYGSVPRYDSENLVHPVITQGALEAKVRLDFRVGDHDYTATRVVRRTKTGATTKEARLERDDVEGGTVLADDAKGLTAAVCDLLGLDLEQFTKCVVLPQGAFATLLHDSKAKRQDLLIKLLDLGVYERVAAAARAECKQAAARIELLDEQLDRAAHATPENVAAAEAHVKAVDGVLSALDEAVPDLQRLDEQLRVLETELVGIERSMAALGQVSIPAGVGDIASRSRAAAVAAEHAEEAEQVTAAAVEEAERAWAQLPDVAVLRGQQRDRNQLEEVRAAVEKGTAMVRDLEESSRPLVEAAQAAADALDHATAALDRARIDHAAADIARHLHDGDACPVCGGRFEGLEHDGADTLAAADAARTAAARSEDQARKALADHEAKLVEYRARLELRTSERDELVERMAGAPAADEIEVALAEVTAAEERLTAARRADGDARSASRAARVAAEDAARRVDEARQQYTVVRDRVSGLGPPPPGDDLAADWASLASWADAKQVDLTSHAADLRAHRDGLVKERTEQVSILADRARAAGVTVGAAGVTVADDTGMRDAGLRDACLTEAATARARHEQLAAERDRVVELRTERAALDERRQIHDLLAEQLGARGFEAWLLDEALDALLEGASAWLEQLSSGRYAMAVDDKKQFAVVDHANAGERRLARTLSGGETFLASLALALALAERVSELSAVGGATLDAIFLDEGFGTLDPATLDVVATAIEELGATGRMVGVISHVPELAERVPVRFEIDKRPGTSVVRRVET